ncbi:High cysteine protein [Giardia lamblia P15]|uniref:High cysteine protein n=1 Tax=Giardia intestinalis (strain P15) TaxID=658858 RepID=E1F3U7_GIAIA|nr:High cysteine protein [Giardia lamblia P15]
MFSFLVCSLAGGALAASVTIDGCAVSVTSMGAEYCIRCSDSSKLPTPDGTACALSCGTNEGIKDCTACQTGKCSKCAAPDGTALVPTSDGLKCVSKCNTSRSAGIEHCQTCTGILQSFQCTTCTSPYTPSSDKKSCVLLCGGVEVANCQECSSGATTCKTCQPGYTPFADGRFCYRTCGTNGPIQYCTGCREQACTACDSLAYPKDNHCVLRRGLEEACSADDPCHVSLECLFSGLGLDSGTKKCFPAACGPTSSGSGARSVCHGQGTCRDTSFNLESQSSGGTCACLSADLSSGDNCGACVNSTLTPSYDAVGTCVAKQGPYEKCSSSLTCQPGLSCYMNYQCVPDDCISGIFLNKVVCDNAGSCGEASFDPSSNKWTATCVCFDSRRIPTDKCTKCTTGTPVGITCADTNCVESKIVCSGHGSCKEDGSGCDCDEGFAPVTVGDKHRCYPSTCGGTPSDSGTYCNNGLGTCLQQLDNSYLCACPAGYRGVETRGSTRAAALDGCVPWSCYPMLNGSICGPFNGGTCGATAARSQVCACHSGFRLTDKGCLPESCGPEPDGSVCLSKGVCKSNGGVWACECLDGYRVTAMGCLSHRCRPTSAGVPCSGHGLCQDNARCKCSAGYAGPACSLTTVALAAAITAPILVLLVAGLLTYVLVKRAIAKREQARVMRRMFPVTPGTKK